MPTNFNELLETLQKLPDLIKALEALAATTIGAILLAIFVFIYLLIQVPKLEVIKSMQKKKDERAKSLADYLAIPAADAACKSVVEDLRDARIFEIATGIYAEKKWRDGLVDLHTRSNVTWLEMKRAWRFLEFDEEGALNVRKSSGWVTTEKFFNYAMTFFFVISGTFIFILAAVQPASRHVFFQFLVAFVLAGMAIWSATQNLPMTAAAKIRANAAAAATAATGGTGGAGGAGGGAT